MERHGELQVEREKVERARVGQATAFLGTMWRTEGAFMPWDVFPELREHVQDDDDEDDGPTMIGGDPAIVMARFQALAAREKVIAEA